MALAPRLVLHHRFGKETVQATLQHRGGSIVFQGHDHQECYQLTFLGVLLTDRGSEIEELLVRYLEYAKDQFRSDPENLNITGETLQEHLRLCEDKTTEFAKVLSFGTIGNWGGSVPSNWTVILPRDVDELAAGDPREYLHHAAVRDYRPDMPTEAHLRVREVFLPAEEVAPGDIFDFIADRRLRTQMGADWREAQNVRTAGGWKSCVILCGSVLEGLFLDALGRDSQRARAAYQQLRRKVVPDLHEWVLSDLVDVAADLGLIDKCSVYLSHALREFRKLGSLSVLDYLLRGCRSLALELLRVRDVFFVELEPGIEVAP